MHLAIYKWRESFLLLTEAIEEAAFAPYDPSHMYLLEVTV